MGQRHLASSKKAKDLKAEEGERGGQQRTGDHGRKEEKEAGADEVDAPLYTAEKSLPINFWQDNADKFRKCGVCGKFTYVNKKSALRDKKCRGCMRRSCNAHRSDDSSLHPQDAEENLQLGASCGGGLLAGCHQLGPEMI